MDGTETVYQALALITRKQDGADELMLVQEADGGITFPGGARTEGDVDMVSALRREFRDSLQLWPEQYRVKETSVTLSFRYEREGAEHFGKTGVIELFDVELIPGYEPRPSGDLVAARWYTFDAAMTALTHEGHHRLLLLAEEHLKRSVDLS